MIEELIKRLKANEDLYHSYQSNIAVQFQDECARFKSQCKNKYLSRNDIYIISNRAAKNFLNLLIKKIEPSLPTPPLGKFLREGSWRRCPKCGSSTTRKWFFGKEKCIHPKCGFEK